jgi:hypothetical protein
MVAMTKRLAEAHPNGPLFRNSDGAAWCCSSVKCRFQRLHAALGLKKLKELGLLPPKIKRLKKAEREDPARKEEHNRRRKHGWRPSGRSRKSTAPATRFTASATAPARGC